MLARLVFFDDDGGHGRELLSGLETMKQPHCRTEGQKVKREGVKSSFQFCNSFLKVSFETIRSFETFSSQTNVHW